MTHWIAVEDELPEDEYGEYLVYLEAPIKHGRRIAFSTWFRDRWVGINGAVWPGMPKPSHWMPLPAPPDDGKELLGRADPRLTENSGHPDAGKVVYIVDEKDE